MESLVGNGLDTDELHLYNHVSGINTDLQFSPIVAKSIFQKNSLTMLPSSLFQQMPLLQVLDLSHTSIQSLPSSISMLSLLENFILQDCSLLTEIPHEIGALKKLKLFDLEGTELMYLPKEIGKLETLECLRVSLSTYADEQKDRSGIEHILPRMTISKLRKLKELSISVNADAEWWEVELLEGIMGDLILLPDLKTVKLYLPTAKALQKFLSLERYQVPLYSNLLNFRFMIGHCEELPCSVQLDIEDNFLKLEKCVKYMNGEGFTDETVDLIRNAKALYLRRHWTIEKLSVFDIRKLKYCCVMECNEMKTLFDQENLCTYKDKSTGQCEDEILGSLLYLSVHFMKNLQRISKGLLSGNSLSCLRILGFHTCPELTSVFTGYLLHNMQSLTELIVEDCPKVKSLVNLEDGTPWNNGPFLLCLKRLSLIDLPELVSISGGVSIAPKLDTLHVFNCMKLDHLSVMELPRDIKEVKGEIEWWDALKYGKLTWNSSSLQVDENSSRDHVNQLLVDHAEPSSNEIQNVSTKDILNSKDGPQPQDSGTRLRMCEPLHPVSGKPPNEDTDYVYKARRNKTASMTKNPIWKYQVKVTKEIEFEKAPDDGYSWEKYGQKEILNAKYPRGYYRCTFRNLHGCLARKQVQRTDKDPSVFEVNYWGQHTSPTVLRNDCSSTLTESAGITLKSNDSSTVTESASIITDSHLEQAEGISVLCSNKKKYSSNSIMRDQVNLSKKVEVNEDTHDGYIWRKYGQKNIVGAKHPREYYKCFLKSPHGCLARKHVQRSDKDPSVLKVTYSGQHTCPTLVTNSCSSTATESACTTSRSIDSSTLTESASTITDSYFEHVEGLHALDSDKEMNSSICIVKDQVGESKVMEVREAIDDGYSWRKYGQKEILGAKHPRLYYRCTLQLSHGCVAKKQVQRSDEDPSVLEITYRGQHTCSRVSTKSIDSTAETVSAFSFTDSRIYPVEADIMEDLQADYFVPYLQHL